MQLKKGIKLIEEKPGEGNPVERHKHYLLSIRISLNKGEIVTAPNKCLSNTLDDHTKLNENGFFEYKVRIDRDQLIDGIFYAVQGMHIGGYRKVAISPHLAYKEKGVLGVIPEKAKIIAEIYVLSEEIND
jgi:FKBP-type peptidyl-prolyl cis-trans isomerase 2